MQDIYKIWLEHYKNFIIFTVNEINNLVIKDIIILFHTEFFSL